MLYQVVRGSRPSFWSWEGCCYLQFGYSCRCGLPGRLPHAVDRGSEATTKSLCYTAATEVIRIMANMEARGSTSVAVMTSEESIGFMTAAKAIRVVLDETRSNL